MVHQYKLAGRNMVLDTNSGSLHQVDDLAYDAIASYKTRTREEITAELLPRYGHMPGVDREGITALLDDIAALESAGQLFTPDVYQELAAGKGQIHGEYKAMCLHVAHTCNLACAYCFAGANQTHGEAALMPFEVGKAALDFLLNHSGTRKNLEVDFFGGEPLLNWAVVKQLVAYGRAQEERRGKRFRFTLTTNGVGLNDEVMDFANREMETVVLSLDGRKSVHDRFRKTPDGRGSYDIVVPKFQELVRRRKGKGYYIRGTFTRHNLDFTEDIFHMADLGFTELSMEPVVCPPDAPYALTEDHLPELFAQYERLAAEMERRSKTGQSFRFYHYTLDLDHGPCVHKRLVGCGVGTEYLAVTPSGAFFPCHQFVGDSKYIMGNVWQGVTTPAVAVALADCNVYTRPACRDCWAKLYCSGGCAANAYHASGDLRGIDAYGCTLFKKRLECALALKANRKES